MSKEKEKVAPLKRKHFPSYSISRVVPPLFLESFTIPSLPACLLFTHIAYKITLPVNICSHCPNANVRIGLMEPIPVY